MISLARKVVDVKHKLLDRINISRAYQSVFSTDEGARVLRHIMRVGYVTKSTFVANDPQQTALNEGSRRLALSILRAAKIGDEQINEIVEQMNNENENLA